MTNPVLDVQQLSVVLPHGKQALPLVNDVSFSVAAGEIYALVGESGSGKTMISRAILRLLPPGTGIGGGRILFQGEDLLSRTPKGMLDVRGRGIGMVFQEPMTSLNPALTIGRQLSEAQQRHFERTAEESRAAAIAMLERLQVPDTKGCLSKYPHEFSGGLRQRILLAGVLSLGPELIIADEPTTALDTLTQQEVLELMVQAVRDIGSSVLLITHDLGVVARYADRVAVLQDGRLLEQATVAALLQEQHHPYTQRLFAAIPRRDRTSVPGDREADALVEIEGVAVDYQRRARLPWRRSTTTRVLEYVDLAVRAGETVALVGESGSGKTTLAKALLGLVPTAAGRIRFAGEPIRYTQRRALRALRRRLQIVFQDPYSALDPRMRVRQIVAEGLRHAGRDKASVQQQVAKMLAGVGLTDDFGDRYPHQLSGGQRQRVNIARALVSEPQLVVADEPVSALDVTVQAEILKLFDTLQRELRFACLFISHDLSVVEHIADRVVVIYRGQVVETGSRNQVFDRPRHPYTCALLNAAPRLVRESRAYRLLMSTAIAKVPDGGFDFDGWQQRPSPRAAKMVEVDHGHRVSCYLSHNT